MNLAQIMSNNELKLEIEQLTTEMGKGQSVVDKIFAPHIQALNTEKEIRLVEARLKPEENIESMKYKLVQAQKDIDEWTQSGKPPKYNALTLATERIRREITNTYIKNHNLELSLLNHIHEAIISNAMTTTGLSEKMIVEGKNGKKLGVQEISSRITPVLTFPNSSKYFNISILPYDTESRKIIGEKTENSMVSSDSVVESANNLQRIFKVHYALAETSAAPRIDIPKSGKKPEVYICSMNGTTQKVTHHIIDTMLRPEFDSKVRELMYLTLVDMYN